MDTPDTRVRGVDPVTFEILSHRLHQVTREMGITLERTGGTVNTTQQRDYMASLYRPDGDILCAGATLGQHVACASRAVKSIIERFPPDEVFEDDVFLLNDPYLAAIHQSDVYVIAPIHYRGRLVAWSATFVHVNDVGANSPGGDSPDATEIFHEGLRVPGIKLVERGRLRQDVFDTLTNMTRQPGMVGLDFKCEIAANNVAKARLAEMYDHYGPELLESVGNEMIRYTEAILRERIASFEEGEWTTYMSCPNAEWFEMNFPVLYLFRRHATDSAGPGRFRGGLAVETAHTPHDAPESRLGGVAYGVAGLRNSGHGMYGGYPGAPSVIVLREGTRVREVMAGDRNAVDLDEVGGQERVLPYCNFDFNEGDVLYMRVASGGGYGDPLARAPGLVQADVEDGVVSGDAARDIYGVVLDPGTRQVDPEATDALRRRLAGERAEA